MARLMNAGKIPTPLLSFRFTSATRGPYIILDPRASLSLVSNRNRSLGQARLLTWAGQVIKGQGGPRHLDSL